MIIIKGGTIITPIEVFDRGYIIIDGRKIIDIREGEIRSLPRRAEVIDASGRIVAPGFIDLQVNGAFGIDFMEKAPDLRQAAALLPSTGATSFLPTFITSSFDALKDGLRAVREAQRAGKDSHHSAEIIGAHLEGPYINPARKGAHPPEHIRSPHPDEYTAFFKAFKDAISLVTLAPEVEGGYELISHLVKEGISVSVGHSQASYDVVEEASRRGARLATHIFNAMDGIHHRDVGTAGALIAHDGIEIGLIADGVHIHPAIVKAAVRAKGVDGVILATDAMAGMMMPTGQYKIGGRVVTVNGASARLSDGTLAGSILTMNRAVRNVMEFAGLSLREAISMASLNPARALGLEDRKGSLRPGNDADVVIMDERVNVYRTITRGATAYVAPERDEATTTRSIIP
jgi:N-acetylglucosamine-6-phosphate deacetylase